MRNATRYPLVLALVLWFSVSLTWGQQQDSFACPSNYQRPDQCTIGPCRCASFKLLLVQTKVVNQQAVTTFQWNVTNYCPDPVYYVGFGIASAQQPVIRSGLVNGQFFSWSESVVNGASPQTPTTPPIMWLQYQANPTPNPGFSNSTQGGGTHSQWEIFQFQLNNYDPTTLWSLQMHQGANWDTFTGVDFSECPCPNCDSGAATRTILPCTLGYPDTSAGAPLKAAVSFNEDEVLHSFAIVGSWLEVFYNDEHALTLGESALISGTTTTNFSFTSYPTNAQPFCAAPVQIGNPAATDSAVCSDGSACGRPIFPSLFITDITNNPNSRSGDWQYGGSPLAPQIVCGVWKNVIGIANGASCPSGTSLSKGGTLCMSNDPLSNQISGGGGWNLGAGSDPVPACNNPDPLASCQNQGYLAELKWDIDTLGLNPASTYRFQFIVHDGDQNHDGGDVGEGCIVATSACPAGYAGSTCSVCDTSPAPLGTNGQPLYQWYCLPTGLGGSNAYQLVKVPTAKVGTSPYNTGFVIADNKTDPQGFQVNCACQRIIYQCPFSCCGSGICHSQTGVCQCANPATSDPSTCCPLPTTPPPTTTAVPTTAPPTTTPAPLTTQPGGTFPPTTTPAPTTTPPPSTSTMPPPTTAPPLPPCYNGGLFCSGNGLCDSSVGNGTCNCTSDNSTGVLIVWTGSACETQTTPSAPPTCAEWSDCGSCMANSSAAGLSCVWCGNNGAGGCFAPALCSSPVYECASPSGNTTYAIPYTPPPCPDNCSGHGQCMNGTLVNATGVISFNTTNGTPVRVCVCDSGYSGINCGASGSGLSAAAIAGISGGIIAAIVIGAVIFFVLVSFAAKKGVDWVRIQEQQMATAHDNPLHTPAGHEGSNATYESPRGDSV